MKKYKFKLENVLKVRNLHKKMAERDLAQTRAKEAHNQRELDNTRENLKESYEFLNADLHNLSFWSDVTFRYQNGLRKRESELEEQKTKIQEQLEKDQSQLRRRQRDEHVIEKLKEYDQQEFYRQADLEEQREIEEIDLLKRGKRK